MTNPAVAAALFLAVAVVAPPSPAQSTNDPPRFRGPQGPQVVSPEVSPDRRATFRILAPKAESVRLSGSDIPGLGQGGQGGQMTKGTNGVWELTLGPIDPAIRASPRLLPHSTSPASGR